MSEDNGREIISAAARAGVLLPLVFHEVFDYRVPQGMEVRAGDYVRVPFGRKSLWGVVWGAGVSEIDEKKVKTIEAVAAHLPPMGEVMIRFIDWVAWYTVSPRGLVLKMALSSPEALAPPEKEKRFQLNKTHIGPKQTPTRVRIVAYLSDGCTRTAKEITKGARVTANVVREFLKAGGLVESAETAMPSAAAPASSAPVGVVLSADQQKATDLLAEKMADGFSVTVLDGVTGSGKTEVYFAAIQKCLRARKQALVLLPEIALSVQWLARFKERFGFAPEVWHSHVSPAMKREGWRRIALGEAPVVVGARSALFLPFNTLGLVVVDEEHDPSYKQEDGIIYQARDMAVVRAKEEKIPIVLVSATPSLESEHNIEQGRYARVHMPARHAEAEIPPVRLIDMRKEPALSGNWLSEKLRAELVRTVGNGSQAMLFLNRRGYAPLMLCRSCGHRFQCPQCTAWLVLHRSKGKLLCHHCGHQASVPKQCPECKKENSMVPCGPGVERVAEEMRALLPAARIEVMTSDHIDTPQKADALVNAMVSGDIDVLIGTQMIAKGHHFAGLALVGVVDADMGLAGGDLRAGERTYQLLHQLAGRAGREKTRGEVWLQTYMPEHPVMQALVRGDRDSFMLLEGRMREEAEMPPYGKLAAIIVEGKQEQEVAQFARELVRSGASLPLDLKAPLLLGPAPAPIALLRGKYRYRILVKAARSFPLQAFLSQWLLARKAPASLRLKIDVDPYSFI